MAVDNGHAGQIARNFEARDNILHRRAGGNVEARAVTDRAGRKILSEESEEPDLDLHPAARG